MKLRSQRTHFMGSSNRISHVQPSRTASVFEKSFNKSKSLYYKTSNQPLVTDICQRKNPFAGSHNQFQTARFDKTSIRPYNEEKIEIPPTQKIVQYSGMLNREVEDIRTHFNGKKINMHKLNELKRTFVKNNRERKNLKQYFEKFSNGSNQINEKGLKKIVKEYGFDITEDEAKLIFKLTNRNGQEKDENGLTLGGFVDLMTKDDIYYKTLKINNSQENQEGKIDNFSQKTHTILRNKFIRLKEAFKIYISRGEEVDRERYNYVMKKMDITNLVMSEKQKNLIFERFSQNGTMNVEGLLGAIAEQQFGRKVKLDKNLDFTDDLRVNDEKFQHNENKIRKFTLKNLSSLEYENQLFKAQTILNQLRRLSKEQKKDIVNEICQGKDRKREQIVKQTQNLLKSNGINFKKEDYDAFAAYLDFDTNDYLSSGKLNKYFFQQTEKQARERFQRKVRKEGPKMHESDSSFYDEETAFQSLKKLKNHKLNPEFSSLFKYFDKDQDGYISKKQFSEGLKKMQIFQNWEINNLLSYFDTEKRGSIEYNVFTTKMNKNQNNQQLPLLRSKQSSSCREWSGTKKSFIKSYNQPIYQRPTKYSAWPQRLIQSDLSLIQPSSGTGMYATDAERFGQRKEDYGMKQKKLKSTIAESRVKRLADWNGILIDRIEESRRTQENRNAANNYFKRLTQEGYEERCHQ